MLEAGVTGRASARSSRSSSTRWSGARSSSRSPSTATLPSSAGCLWAASAVARRSRRPISIRGWSGRRVHGGSAPYMRQLANRVVTELDAMGWRHDAHGVDATGAMSASRSRTGERLSRAGWPSRPPSRSWSRSRSCSTPGRSTDRADLDVPSLLRGAHLRPGCCGCCCGWRWPASRRPAFCATSSSSTPASTRAFRHQARRPAADRQRRPLRGPRRGATTTSTVERLRAAAEGETLSAADAATLEEAFELFCELRLEHQVGQLKPGSPPTT